MKDSGDWPSDAMGTPGLDWQISVCPAGLESPSLLTVGPQPEWIAAPGPATAVTSLKAAGRWHADMPGVLARSDVWYRLNIRSGPARELHFEGVAGRVEFWLDDALLAHHDTMFRPATLAIPAVTDEDTWLYLCIRGPQSWSSTRTGRARWRPRMVVPSTLREVRQTLLGHMPGWCPDLPAMGPYAPLSNRAPNPPPIPEIKHLHADWGDGTATLELVLAWAPPMPERSGAESPALQVSVADSKFELIPDGTGRWTLQASLAGVVPWWPHTHGYPQLYEIEVLFAGERRSLGRVGFRRIEFDPLDSHGGLKVNGVDVFCRGVCWTPPDLDRLWVSASTYQEQVQRIAAGGMNMIRIGGTMVYESGTFYAACDAAGVLVWQDYMLANFDYPARDPEFLVELEREARYFLRRTAIHPCIAVLCGGSEVRQQAEMLGSNWPAEDPIYEGLLKRVSAELRPHSCYVPNSPWGGATPFSTRSGITHYYGVGAYMRPLEDVRRADVGFAAECLALAHLPGEADLDGDLARQPGNADWKRGTPRDRGAGWDFDDVRDHYVHRLYGVDPARLRYEDAARYLDLGRAVSCDLAESLFSEWRRPASRCAGALIWQLRDFYPGAGWGLWNADAQPKPVWHALQRLFRPLQLLVTDEGLDGLDLYVVNETAEAREVALTLTCLREGAAIVVQGRRDLAIPGRGDATVNSNELFGKFHDTAYAYRFGPLSHEVAHGVLRDARTQEILSESFHLPRRDLGKADLGLQAEIGQEDNGLFITVSTRRFAQYVHFKSPAYVAQDDWFHLAPGHPRRVRLQPRHDAVASDPALCGGLLTALNALAPTWIKLPVGTAPSP